VLGRPIGDFALVFSKVLASGDVDLGLEGHGVVEAGELGALVGLSEAEVRGLDRDALPDFLGESLVGVGGGCQLRSDPVFRYSGMVMGLLV